MRPLLALAVVLLVLTANRSEAQQRPEKPTNSILFDSSTEQDFQFDMRFCLSLNELFTQENQSEYAANDSVYWKAFLDTCRQEPSFSSVLLATPQLPDRGNSNMAMQALSHAVCSARGLTTERQTPDFNWPHGPPEIYLALEQLNTNEPRVSPREREYFSTYFGLCESYFAYCQRFENEKGVTLSDEIYSILNRKLLREMALRAPTVSEPNNAAVRSLKLSVDALAFLDSIAPEENHKEELRKRELLAQLLERTAVSAEVPVIASPVPLPTDAPKVFTLTSTKSKPTAQPLKGHRRAEEQAAKMRLLASKTRESHKVVFASLTEIQRFASSGFEGSIAEMQILTNELHPIALRLIKDHRLHLQNSTAWVEGHKTSVGLYKKAAAERRTLAASATGYYKTMYLQQAEIAEQFATDNLQFYQQNHKSLKPLSDLAPFIEESELFLQNMKSFLKIFPEPSATDERILTDLENYVQGFDALRQALESFHQQVTDEQSITPIAETDHAT